MMLIDSTFAAIDSVVCFLHRSAFRASNSSLLMMGGSKIITRNIDHTKISNMLDGKDVYKIVSSPLPLVPVICPPVKQLGD